MRYRRLDENGDMVFGSGGADFLSNSPETVAQAVRTRLGLQLGDWFLDLEEGIDWRNRVLGKFTVDTRDLAIRERILNSEGVTELAEYSSQLDSGTRAFSVGCVINTIYGAAVVKETI